MTIGDMVYVVDWGKHYSTIDKFFDGKRVNIFPIKTKLPDYCGIDYHWKHVYEPNLTQKGTVNKREPKKLVEKIPVYKNYKWEIIEVFKHPQAGEFYYDDEQRKRWNDYSKYPTEDIFLLASTHTDKDWMKCYIVISCDGVSKLTPEQYADQQFNALIESNLNKWVDEEARRAYDANKIPKEILSVFYDENDRVLFGSSVVRGLVSYHYIDAKFTVENKHIYLGTSILYDGKGNAKCPNPELIKPFSYIKSYLES